MKDDSTTAAALGEVAAPAVDALPASAPVAERLIARVLIVDDDAVVARIHAGLLAAAGHHVTCVAGGYEAMQQLQLGAFDAIVSDIAMPDMDGIAMLRAVRATGSEVPVVLVTGQPALETAMKAVEYGATRYLVKPVAPRLLREAIEQAAQLSRLARIKREAVRVVHGVTPEGDNARLAASFTRALDGLYLAFQPIVSWSERRVVAYEALMRSREAALPDPLAVLAAAERLGRVHELGRWLRGLAADAVAGMPADARLFVNIHPDDLADEALYADDALLATHAARVTLEVTERAELPDRGRTAQRLVGLRTLGYRIAIDDLGAGYAGLSTFATLTPEVAKIDMSLVRGIDGDPQRSHVVRAVVGLCRDMGVTLVAEGVETAAECAQLVALGCDLLQGYYFGRPQAAFGDVPDARWGGSGASAGS